MAMDENRAVPPAEPGRILVVDDNQDNIEIIATRLRFRGYDILEASDGRQALAWCGATRRTSSSWM
jgi:CheY-like chemotaxis protein